MQFAQPNFRVKLRGHDGAIHQRNVGIAMTLNAIVVVPSVLSNVSGYFVYPPSIMPVTEKQ
jgi:hypothetical protein